MRKNLLAFPALLTLIFGALFIQKPIALAKQATDFQVFDPVADVYFEIEERFYRDVDRTELQRGMIRGMIEALDDPYTEYIPPANLDDFDKRIRGEYVGIGAEVNTRDGFMLIVSPMDDSPAYNAGLEAGDLIVAVDGLTTFDKTLEEIIEELTGTPGTTVTVTVQREGDENDLPTGALPPSVPGELDGAPGPEMNAVRFDLEIVRRRIVTSTVKGVHRVNDEWDFMIDPVRKIGYVRVSQFTGGTIPELVRACLGLVEQDVKGLILDLRFNSGGSLAAAVQMADLFLDDGLIVSTKGRNGREERAYARKDATLPHFPMIVLVNGQSASASEVVSGALADNDRAIILGERTFGKGIVQTVIPLKSGEGHLKITEQDYYVPSGRSIQRENDSVVWGVDPDPGFYLPMTNDEYREMLRVRRQQEIIRPGDDAHENDANWADPEWILETLKDKQLGAAVASLRTKIATDEWDTPGADVPEGTLELAAMRLEEERYELLLKELARSQQRIDALSTAAAESDEDPFDKVPGEENLAGGVMTLRDAEGNIVAEFTVGARSLDRWLWDAPLEMKAAAEAAEGETEQ